MNTNKHEMSDDELDHLFRESAEKMDFDFDPDSWAKMSQKLDAVVPPPSSGRGTNPWPKRSLLLLIGLFALVGGYFLLKPSAANQSKETQANTIKNTESEAKEIDSKKYVETSKVDTDNLKLNEKTTETTANIESNKEKVTTKEAEVLVNNDKNSELKKSIETKKSIEKQKIGFSEKPLEKHSKGGQSNSLSEETNKIRNNSKGNALTKNTKNGSVNTTLSKISIESNANLGAIQLKEFSDKRNVSKSRKRTNNAQTLTNTENADINSSLTNLNITNQTSNSVPTTHVTIEENRLILNNLTLLSPKETFIKSNINLLVIAFENQQKQAPIIPKSTPQSFKKGLYFRIGISPDLSWITADELTKFGSNLALMLEYRFNNRLSIQGGVLRSMKYYDAYPESYEWPYNWPSPPKLIDINATCKMLDIPVNIRYDISQKKLSRLFVSAGATSYVMLNEKYVYNYENPNDPKIKWNKWEGKTGPYYLGVLNFSMGYEYQLFRKLSIQAEPFFKLPIAKVGFGQVNLSTLGLLVSAKYPIYTHK